MVDVGPNSGSTAVESTSEPVSWTNPNNILTQNDTYASASVVAQQPESIYASTLGFSIPAGATITHLRIEVDMLCNVTPTNDFALRCTKTSGASIAGQRTISRFSMPTSDTDTYLDTGFVALASWAGLTLTPAEANAASFGVGFGLIFDDTLTILIDHARASIRYVENPGTPDMQPMPKGRYVRRPGSNVYTQEDAPLSIATLPDDQRFLMGASIQ